MTSDLGSIFVSAGAGPRVCAAHDPTARAAHAETAFAFAAASSEPSAGPTPPTVPSLLPGPALAPMAKYGKRDARDVGA